MRHAKKINHLGRTDTHRKAMLSNMASSLILHKRISTTVAKAKALRTYVEPLITRSKQDTTHSRRTVFSYLQDKTAVSELFREVSPKIMERPGGYTRILKTGFRKGDAAEMCVIELVDYNENMLAAKDAKKTTTRRSRRSGGKKAAGAIASAAAPAAEKIAKASKAAVLVEDAKVVEEVEEVKVVEDAKVIEEVEEVKVVEEVKNDAVEAPETETPAGTDETKE
jgi:large subunit ribosomal protein L17